MAIRPIVDYPAAVLLNPGDPVESFDGELQTLVQDMFDTMYDAEGVGLAADAFVCPSALIMFPPWALGKSEFRTLSKHSSKADAKIFAFSVRFYNMPAEHVR